MLHQDLNKILTQIQNQDTLEKEFLTPLKVLILKSFLTQSKIHEILNSYFDNMNRLSCAGKTYTPIQKVNQRGEIESLTKQIVQTIVSQLSGKEDLAKDLKDCLNYVVSELLNNVADHSGSYGWTMAQYYPTKRIVEVAVIDMGCGFLRRLSSKFLNIKSEIEAIDEAVKKGITASMPTIYGSERNSGFGLFIILSLAKQIGNSELLVVSNDSAVSFYNHTREEIRLPFSIDGSLICFSLDVNKLEEIEYDIDVLINFSRFEDEEFADDESEEFEIF
ncbi:hypothetical protein [Helicobacter kayseriensis]|uniref:hypothetical protein n=1 Tax=Helicobacter kayseriensis TaxID=2905877 RepID=UPI001E5237C8|nr:hypothetical protein [Helicobacter kayseriensis]MCE3047390.1 hypothetical protein [Helicobacter kayseriensis]MCE3048939.1 hypothetical protein [Helicobacter kayseriensis]